jgi:proteasome lid subunit RPN8/RPN11
VIVGVMAQDQPWILAGVAVPNASSQLNAYVLPKNARPQSVALYRRIEPRAGYLGDWHSHPGNVGPSSLDIQSLKLLSRANVVPLLILAILVDQEFAVMGYRLKSGQLEAVSLEMSGPLERRST